MYFTRLFSYTIESVVIIWVINPTFKSLTNVEHITLTITLLHGQLAGKQ